jgi:hypothetical protein
MHYNKKSNSKSSKLIGSTKESLLELEKKISIISDLDNSNNIISPELRVLWQQELEKRRKFNADRADEWLNKAAISIDYVSNLSLLLKKITVYYQISLNLYPMILKF